MKRTYQYRAKINRTTEKNSIRWLDLCRQLYNNALKERISVWQDFKIGVTSYEQKIGLPFLKTIRPEFKSVGSQVLQDVLERLDLAFKHFFRRIKERDAKAGFPRFKSEHRYNSFTLKQAGWTLDGNILHIAKLGKFKLYLSREILGDIKTITVVRKSSGKWFVSFSCDNVPEKPLPENDKAIGIDVGLKVLLADSDGNIIENPRHLKQNEEKLKVLNEELKRKQLQSKRHEKARLKRARLYEKVANQRKDFIYKVVHHYVNEFQTICIEDLNIVNMIQTGFRRMNKHILDASWDLFAKQLFYKAVEAGRTIIAINPKNTSKMCSQCGTLVEKKLSTRIHKCPNCSLVLDRDINAARNILQLGMTSLIGTYIKPISKFS